MFKNAFEQTAILDHKYVLQAEVNVGNGNGRKTKDLKSSHNFANFDEFSDFSDEFEDETLLEVNLIKEQKHWRHF